MIVVPNDGRASGLDYPLLDKCSSNPRTKENRPHYQYYVPHSGSRLHAISPSLSSLATHLDPSSGALVTISLVPPQFPSSMALNKRDVKTSLALNQPSIEEDPLILLRLGDSFSVSLGFFATMAIATAEFTNIIGDTWTQSAAGRDAIYKVRGKSSSCAVQVQVFSV
jgi:hypothetical protein